MSIVDLDRVTRIGRLMLRAPGRTLSVFGRALPKGLYARSLLIIVVPMVLLQSVVAFVFMERHWQTVTQRLSAAVSRDIAAVVDFYRAHPDDEDTLRRIAAESLELIVEVMPPGPFPPLAQKPFFSLLDEALSVELSRRIEQPFWIDTVGRSSLIEIRVRVDDAVLRILTRRNQAYASNSHIFLVWMVGTSLVLLIVAILFLRNQIRPIQALADAAESFGKGRKLPDFRPRGAREVRRAAYAFIEMRDRIERQIEQRTAMLAGVSHDLRTILTRFKLEIALLGEGEETRELARDVDEMTRMLEAYLAFARGDSGEIAQPTDVPALLEELKVDAERHGNAIETAFFGAELATIRPDAFKRCLANLIGNASRFGRRIIVTATHGPRHLTVTVDDDGPGIAPEDRETVFRPFLRLDHARNQDYAGTGLGLAIARDVARGHGGDVTLGESPLGGLRATVRVPA
ncbi:two-component sensor histidine kinase [Agaricicola taiwanensis]|uniref:histidine kinase n=1 Tax=Agaricicola taiwanensis TaxID=591372 RepID=A0A8J2VSC7_9RHOB|nr:ATP-binding protein [Agaricicola taiwanensis]GGE40265.1 two-component sensor histidine kinase [Agaricicola taiwanensis]